MAKGDNKSSEEVKGLTHKQKETLTQFAKDAPDIFKDIIIKDANQNITSENEKRKILLNNKLNNDNLNNEINDVIKLLNEYVFYETQAGSLHGVNLVQNLEKAEKQHREEELNKSKAAAKKVAKQPDQKQQQQNKPKPFFTQKEKQQIKNYIQNHTYDAAIFFQNDFRGVFDNTKSDNPYDKIASNNIGIGFDFDNFINVDGFIDSLDDFCQHNEYFDKDTDIKSVIMERIASDINQEVQIEKNLSNKELTEFDKQLAKKEQEQIKIITDELHKALDDDANEKKKINAIKNYNQLYDYFAQQDAAKIEGLIEVFSPEAKSKIKGSNKSIKFPNAKAANWQKDANGQKTLTVGGKTFTEEEKSRGARYIDFPKDLSDTSECPIRMFMAARDENGKIVDDLGFTAVYGKDGKIAKIDLPMPVLFTQDKEGTAYIIQDGKKYTLPINKDKYIELQQAIAQNLGVDKSQQVEQAQDQFTTGKKTDDKEQKLAEDKFVSGKKSADNDKTLAEEKITTSQNATEKIKSSDDKFIMDSSKKNDPQKNQEIANKIVSGIDELKLVDRSKKKWPLQFKKSKTKLTPQQMIAKRTGEIFKENTANLSDEAKAHITKLAYKGIFDKTLENSKNANSNASFDEVEKGVCAMNKLNSLYDVQKGYQFDLINKYQAMDPKEIDSHPKNINQINEHREKSLEAKCYNKIINIFKNKLKKEQKLSEKDITKNSPKLVNANDKPSIAEKEEKMQKNVLKDVKKQIPQKDKSIHDVLDKLSNAATRSKSKKSNIKIDQVAQDIVNSAKDYSLTTKSVEKQLKNMDKDVVKLVYEKIQTEANGMTDKATNKKENTVLQNLKTACGVLSKKAGISYDDNEANMLDISKKQATAIEKKYEEDVTNFIKNYKEAKIPNSSKNRQEQSKLYNKFVVSEELQQVFPSDLGNRTQKLNELHEQNRKKIVNLRGKLKEQLESRSK
ncbi:MAG: hypothetical protein HRU35_02025 [Rickettsiaceae bacterium]|nr:hypothetical protein [Rickettsiaceae bacterium]